MLGIFSVYKDFVESFYKFGNLSMMCPLKKGYYYFKDLFIDDSHYPAYLANLGSGTYITQAIVADESSKSKVWMSTNELFMIFTSKRD
jgi:hypothetical protein